MESKPLVLTDPNMLAEFVRQSQLKTFWEKRYAAPADLGSILLRDGAVVDGYKGTQFSIGGLWENMKGLIGGSHHYEILLVDLKPFQAVIPVRAMSKDMVEIVGEATFELQLDPDKPTNVLGLMRGVGRNESDDDDGTAGQRKALTVPDVVMRLEPQFRERVFGTVISRHNAEEIRGNAGLQDQIQADMMKEAERILGDLGVIVRSATTNWAVNEAERMKFEQARIAREEEMKDYQLDLLKRQVEREGDATSFMLQTKLDQAKLKQASEDELRMMVLDSEVEFADAREEHARRQEFSALKHEADILLEEHRRKTEVALAETDDAIAKTKAQHALRKVEFDLRAFESDFNRQQQKLDSDFRRSEERKGAEHEVDVTKTKLKGRDATFEQDLKEAKAWQDEALRKLATMDELELKKESGKADIEIRKTQAESQSQVDKMLAAGSLTPEQLSEVMPGLSREAADVAIERAKAEGKNAQQMLDMARQMTTESRDHEHRMFETGMQGGTGMAAGLGGKDTSGGPGGGGSMVECPNCKTMNPAKAKFCKACSHQLRN